MKQQFRVLYVSSARSIGGGEVYLYDLARALGQEYEQFIFCRKELRSYFKTAGLKPLPYWPNLPSPDQKWRRRFYHRWQKLSLALFLYWRRPHLVSVQSFTENISKLQSICKQLNIPAILTAHTLFDPSLRPLYEGNIPFFNQFDSILCVCEASKTNLQKLGINRPRLIVLHNGVNTDLFKPMSNERQWVIWVGRVDDTDKNAGCFVDIAELAQKEGLTYKFKMVGEGPLLPALKERAKALQLKNLSFSGFLEHGPDLYKDAAALCLTSTSEAMPLSVLEAMACGVPVVSTAVGGVPEVINSHKVGKLVDQAKPSLFVEVLKRDIFADQRAWQKLSEASRKRIAEHFEAAKQYAKIKTVYEGIVDENRH